MPAPTSVPIRLYDLAGAEDERLFSPYCWRVKLAMAHKGLGWESIPWRFTDKETIGFSGQGSVPVIVDGSRVVSDSWQIARYLDEAYPHAPVMDTDQARGAIFAFKLWCERNIHPAIIQAVILDLYAHVHPRDQDYFRASREKRFGKTLEAFGAGRNEAIEALQRALDGVRPVLSAQPYFGGATPSFADHILCGAFLWARAVSPVRLLAQEDIVFTWRERMLDAYGGLGRRAFGYPV